MNKILFDKGIYVITDILAYAGGVCVSYFENVQDIRAYFWDIDHINRKLKQILLEAVEEVYKVWKERKIALRTAVYIISVSRMLKPLN